MLFVWITIGVGIWYLIGCGIGASLDDENESLFKWIKTCPGGYVLGVMLWPLWTWAWWKDHDK